MTSYEALTAAIKKDEAEWRKALLIVQLMPGKKKRRRKRER